jgi:NADH-quinone oxidoreductase subunit B
MIVAGRVSQKMAPVLRQIYDQMPEPRWVLAMGVCASSGGMFNNYAIVQGVDHIVPVDMYLPGCPPRPEMLMDAILKLHHKIQNEPLGEKRARQLERDREDGTAKDLHIEMPSTVRVDKTARRAYEDAAAEGRTGQFLIERRGGNAVLLPDERPAGLGKAWR